MATARSLVAAESSTGTSAVKIVDLYAHSIEKSCKAKKPQLFVTASPVDFKMWLDRRA